MRKFSTFAGMMPHDLIEARAKIYNDFENKHCPGDNVSFCRFGFAISWCDGSGQSHFVEDEKIETAIESAKRYLASKGWHLGEITYTGAVLTDEIIEERTTKMKTKSDAVKEYSRFLRLKMECLEQSWFDAVRSDINGAISVANIADLPDEIRNHEYRNELISFYNDKVTVKLNYTIEDDYVRGGQWVEIGEARGRLGMDGKSPDISVVNRIVADLLEAYEHRTDKARERKAMFIERFTRITDLFGKAIEECARDPLHVSESLATLEAYINLDWRRGLKDRDSIFDIVRKFESRVHMSTIEALSLNRPYFDWSTLVIKKEGGLTIGKVKIDTEVYESVRKRVKEMSPEAVEHNTEIQSSHRCTSDWRSTGVDAQWWNFIYGIDTEGNAIMSEIFAPGTMEMRE
jgi:hypothetical protein